MGAEQGDLLGVPEWLHPLEGEQLEGQRRLHSCLSHPPTRLVLFLVTTSILPSLQAYAELHALFSEGVYKPLVKMIFDTWINHKAFKASFLCTTMISSLEFYPHFRPFGLFKPPLTFFFYLPQPRICHMHARLDSMHMTNSWVWLYTYS